jgi:hypothetical protein
MNGRLPPTREECVAGEPSFACRRAGDREKALDALEGLFALVPDELLAAYGTRVPPAPRDLGDVVRRVLAQRTSSKPARSRSRSSSWRSERTKKPIEVRTAISSLVIKPLTTTGSVNTASPLASGLGATPEVRPADRVDG